MIFQTLRPNGLALRVSQLNLTSSGLLRKSSAALAAHFASGKTSRKLNVMCHTNPCNHIALDLAWFYDIIFK